MALELEGLTAVAFLDKFERFAKSEEEVVTVRLFYAYYVPPDDVTDLTWAEYKALTLDERTTIQNAGSGAGYVDTEHKSNA